MGLCLVVPISAKQLDHVLCLHLPNPIVCEDWEEKTSKEKVLPIKL